MPTPCLRDFETTISADTVLPPSLVRAYQAAHYRIDNVDWQLQLGRAQPALAAYYQRHGVQCAAYLTACNPEGQLHTDTSNQHRMAQLRHSLQRAGWAWLDGQGHDPQGQWPAEDSVLVWGMGESTARAWGAQYAQNAVVWCGADQTPQLLLLR